MEVLPELEPPFRTITGVTRSTLACRFVPQKPNGGAVL